VNGIWYEHDLTDSDFRSALKSFRRVNKTLFAQVENYVRQVYEDDGRDFDKWFACGILLTKIKEEHDHKAANHNTIQPAPVPMPAPVAAKLTAKSKR
jgi:hypothetical protein